MAYIPPESIIASGPVFVRKNPQGEWETLLNIAQPTAEKPTPKWQFCGGEVEDFSTDLIENAQREFREEMNGEFSVIAPLAPMMIYRPDKNIIVILAHWLAQLTSDILPGPEIRDWGWYTLSQLPTLTPGVQPNVEPIFKEAITHFSV